MATMARWCVKHRAIVVLAWLAALVLMAALAHASGSRFSNTFSLPATDSSRALAVLKAEFPSQSGDVEQLVFAARQGSLDGAEVRDQIEAAVTLISHVGHVVSVASPYQTGAISADRRIGLGNVYLDAQAQDLPSSVPKALVDAVHRSATGVVDVQIGGRAVEEASQNRQPASEALGVLLSLVVLFFAFRRSLLCALLPLVSALAAIGIGTSAIALLSQHMAIPQFGPILATLVSLGVGVDYALFIVSRHRSGLLGGRSVGDAVVRSVNTSGRAVFFAGLTVCIALLGMFALQVSFLYGVAVSAALVVALTMGASLTLLPALLSFFGLRALRRQERRLLAAGPRPESAGGFWRRWSEVLHRRSSLSTGIALGIIVVVALPFFSLRQGLTDAGNDPPGSTTRQAYDLLAQGFGPGYNGPLELVALTPRPTDAARFGEFVSGVRGVPGVASVAPIRSSPSGQAAVALVYPTTSPQSRQTSQLLHRIRRSVPAAEAGTGLVVHVGGVTASQVDFASVLSGKMPQFVAVVVVLAFVLLMAVFRSLLVPLLASVMNLLSIGAALGVLTAGFQWGWGKSVLGYTEAGPIEVFLPVMLFAILFGLSMDYEVFLVSRMHEEWVLSGDNDVAVSRGMEETGRVITAAATIMILVFLSFILGGQLVIKEFGLGFASAIFMDAFVIRTVLVPSLMHVLGRSNWWLPGWLDRILPTLHVEPDDLSELPDEPPVSVPG